VGEVRMVEKGDASGVVTPEELLRSFAYEQEALRRVLVRKGLLSDEELLNEIKAVRLELEAKQIR